jgi:hypothetical protein
LLLSVPLAKLAMLPREGVRQGRFEVFVVVQDADGQRAPVCRAEVPLSIPETRWEVAQGQLYGYRINLRMEPGEHALAVAVRDVVGNTTSYLSQPLNVEPVANRSAAAGDGR